MATNILPTKLPGIAIVGSPNRHSYRNAHLNRLFSSLAAEPGKNELKTAISSLLSFARFIRSAPTVFVVKNSFDFISDESELETLIFFVALTLFDIGIQL